MCVCPKRSVPERIRQRWGNEDFQEWSNLWYWHCVGTAWSGGRRITFNYVGSPVGSENTGASLEGREAVTRVTRWPCLKPCQAVVGLKAELRVSTARPGAFSSSPVHTLTRSAWEVIGNQNYSSSWFLVSEVERIAWSSFHTVFSELHCPLISYTWVFTHIFSHFINRISFFFCQ